jgi:hypothetical protein
MDRITSASIQELFLVLGFHDFQSRKRNLTVAIGKPSGSDTGDTNSSDQLSVEQDWLAALKRDCGFLSKMPEAREISRRQIVVEYFGGTAEGSRCARLRRSQVDASKLTVAHTMQKDQVAAIIANGDCCVPALLGCKGLTGLRDLFREFQRYPLTVGMLMWNRCLTQGVLRCFAANKSVQARGAGQLRGRTGLLYTLCRGK